LTGWVTRPKIQLESVVFGSSSDVLPAFLRGICQRARPDMLG